MQLEVDGVRSSLNVHISSKRHSSFRDGSGWNLLVSVSQIPRLCFEPRCYFEKWSEDTGSQETRHPVGHWDPTLVHIMLNNTQVLQPPFIPDTWDTQLGFSFHLFYAFYLRPNWISFSPMETESIFCSLVTWDNHMQKSLQCPWKGYLRYFFFVVAHES